MNSTANLKELSVFSDCPNSLMEEMENAKIQSHYKKGQTIHYQGTPFFGLSCIVNGLVKKVKSLDSGEDTIISVCERGDFFGVNCVLSNTTSFATYSTVAMENSTIYFFDKTFMQNQLKKYPQFAMNLIGKLKDCIERHELRILSLSKKSVRERVAETLINLVNSYGTASGKNSVSIPNIFSRIELSSLAGTANETLIRTLSELQKEGVIKLKNGCIDVIAHDELKSYMGAAV
ncbi:MAG: Crp/Fnr family transcriptional regulator [Bdellovibrio sp.]|nr:Crp/Fnr family transcriptional regulator [Bdellovibrio sp.]